MKRVVIIGAGITGLLTALELYDMYQVTIIDAGPDPRHNTHTLGATYSGFDARHISFTETSPWTSKARYELITTDTKEDGWLCIPEKNLNTLEQEWINEFRHVAKNPNTHVKNTSIVIDLNKKGVAGWETLSKIYDFISPVVDTKIMPIICRTEQDFIDEFNNEYSIDNNCVLYEKILLPSSLAPLQAHANDLGNIGYFTLHGSSFLSKTLCNNLIHYLESHGVSFVWDQYVSNVNSFDHDIIIWCSGISLETANLLSKFNILLGGVIGCWIEADNAGITVPCKIFGPEPVNYINITPHKNTLLMSGGYGFVGTRAFSEAAILAKPIMAAMTREVKKWLPNATINDQAYCIRPATPTGVPTLETFYVDNKKPMIIAVGHCAGGFTQAPYTAELIKKKLDNL